MFNKDIYIDNSKTDLALQKPLVTLDQVYFTYKHKRLEAAFTSISASWETGEYLLYNDSSYEPDSFGKFVDYMKTVYTIY
jgi:hypothetical protein